MIYQELFPTFFLLSKSLNVSCPPIQIGGMGAGNTSETIDEIENETFTQESIEDDVLPELTAETKLDNPDVIQPNM